MNSSENRAEHNGKPPRDPRAAAGYYLERGLLPIPVPFRGKAPIIADWSNLRPGAANLDSLFPPGHPSNIGVLLGAPSGNIVDVDLDGAEAIAAATVLMPPTPMVSGRKSKPRSHLWYRVDPAPDKTAQFRDPINQVMILELRNTGGQTVAPWSVHPSGEVVGWHSFGEPAEEAVEELRVAVQRTAAAALLARYWPGRGGRHGAALALAGGLLSAEWAADAAKQFLSAVCAGAHDDELNDRLAAVESTAAKIADGAEATGWTTLTKSLKDDGAKIVQRVKEWLEISSKSGGRKSSAAAEPPWPSPLVEEAYHGLAGEIVRTIEPASEAIPVALLIQILVGFGNLLGRTAYFRVEADRHFASEFAVLVGKSSKAHKGTSWGHIHRLLTAAEEPWAEERIQTGLSSGEGLIWAVRDPIEKMEKVKERGEPRYEQVTADPGVEDKRLFVVEPEYANVLKQTERQGNTLSALLRQAWECGDLRTLTKNSPAKATGAHISLIGHITTEELRRYLATTEMANGFANRHLWLCVTRSKALPEGGTVDEAVLSELQTRLSATVTFARQQGEMRRDEGAREIWREVYGQLSADRPGLPGALLGRAEAHVLRLSLLYALLDCSPVIRVPHLMAALGLWEYCEQTVIHIWGDSIGDPIADELLRLLRAASEGLSRNQLCDHFGRNVPSERIATALTLLASRRLAAFENRKTGGRPREIWKAVPR